MTRPTRTAQLRRRAFDLSLVVLAIALIATVGRHALQRDARELASDSAAADGDAVASLVLLGPDAPARAREMAAPEPNVDESPVPMQLSSPAAERLLGGAIAIVSLAPDRRLIRQDGSVVREGERIADGVLLDSIASDVLELRLTEDHTANVRIIVD